MKYFKKNFRKQVEGDEEAMHVATAVTGKRSPSNREQIGIGLYLVDNASMQVLEGPASEAAFHCTGTTMVHPVAVYISGQWSRL